jgi:hypothetical protein
LFMEENFEKALGFVLKWEGGLVDPSPGRDGNDETNLGIDESFHPNIEVEELTLERAKKIYRTEYWLAAGCDKIASPLDIVVFDTAVHCGVTRAVGWLGLTHRIPDYLFMRLGHYSRTSRPNDIYLRGWLNRVVDLWKFVKPEMPLKEA